MDEQGVSERLLEETKRRLEVGEDPNALLYDVVKERAALESVLFLIEVGADANNALWAACFYGAFSMVNYLLTNENIHVDINKPEGGETALHRACCKTNNAELVQFLLDHNAKVNSTTRSGDTPLHLVCRFCNTNDDGAIDMIERLLEEGANINAINNYRNTPLSQACNLGNMRVVQFLLQRGANVGTGNSPVYAATSHGHFDIAELLLENGALLNDPRLDEEWKTIRIWNDHELNAAGPFIARIERDPCLRGCLRLNLGDLNWNELLSSYCRILFANELEELYLQRCPIECLPLLTERSIPLLQVDVQCTLFRDHSQQVWSALCQLLESNDGIQKVIFDFPWQPQGSSQHGFASRVMHSLFANSTIVAFSARSFGKAIITQKDVDCVCLRNKAMPLMKKAGYKPLWPQIFYRIGNTTSAMTAWEASVTFALVRTAVPAFLMALPVDNKRDLS